MLVANWIKRFPKRIVCQLNDSYPIVVTPDESRYNITLVTVGSRNRLFVMPIFVRRWNG